MPLQRRLRLLSDPSETRSMNDTAIRVAFATSNLKEIDQHFGAAESFAIHAIDAETAGLLGASWTPAFVVALDQQKCIGCESCSRVCPKGCLSHEPQMLAA
ncbi:4Fe-4S binding protein [Allochromatium tepidum]|uniref:4Fe-4S ferredoxin-type domain-containing protein n=1 Tax=Allochromatium tepidum TaxID=553982 RepID=A0ABN6GDM4_9GAMM|nr:4Fe-4S binding protein [Allochromatium tepidum]BCU08051.1 hypothetical protein Atep_27280 [Allochromatium tepidum]